MDEATKETIIIIIILFILYLHEYKKESFTLPSKNIPFIKINNKSQIAIVTVLPKKLTQSDHILIQNYKMYCNQSNLALYIFINNSLTPLTKWNSVNTILEVLKNKNHKYAIWMNPNIVFNKSNIRFTKYISQYKEADIIFSKDPQFNKHSFSMKIIIFKNTDWTNQILNKVINNKKYYKGEIIIENFGEHIGEHIILENIIQNDALFTKKKDTKNIHKNIMILPYHNINAFPSKKTLKENFILNISNIPQNIKYKLIYHINEQLI